MKNLDKKDLLIGVVLLFALYKLNGIKFNVSGKSVSQTPQTPCGCGNTVKTTDSSFLSTARIY